MMKFGFSKIMQAFSQGSLKKKLTLSFGGVVLLAAALSSAVFTVFLVENFKKSIRQQLKETFRVAEAKIQEISRGYEIYTDLIASDIQFGQLLAYDSEVGIQSKVEEFVGLSQSEIVVFVPRPEQYIQIKDQIFVNSGNEPLKEAIKKWAIESKLLEPFPEEGAKGWMSLEKELFLFAAKPVLHFGTNMGFIFIGSKANNELSQSISKATGTEIIMSTQNKIMGFSFEGANEDLSKLVQDKKLFNEGQKLLEEIEIEKQSFAAYVNNLFDVQKNSVGQMALLISNKELLEARKKTLQRAVVIAALTALLSAFIGLLIAKAIANPLLEMTDGIEKIGKLNDLSIRIPKKYDAEVGVLANSFNGLMGRLEEANQKLAESEQRMKAELTMASTVQEMLFPVRSLQLDSIELASFIEASTETGGDWYGYNEGKDKKSVYVMVGDVTGHGMPAALVTAISNGFFRGVLSIENLVSGKNLRLDDKSLLRNIRDIGMSMAEVLHNLNQLLIDVTQGKLLMTFFASVLNVESKKLYYANAGHNRPFILRKKANGKVSPSILQSPPSQRLGEKDIIEFEENSIQLEKDDLVVWYTDGILECSNAEGEQYGRQRLLRKLKKMIDDPCDEIVQKVIQDAYAFYGEVPREDDVTLVIGRIV